MTQLVSKCVEWLDRTILSPHDSKQNLYSVYLPILSFFFIRDTFFFSIENMYTVPQGTYCNPFYTRRHEARVCQLSEQK